MKHVLGHFASGVTVVAAAGEDGRPAGLAVQSFASLSLAPPLVLLCVGKNSTSWPKVERVGRFGVSILAEDQREVCAALGRPGPGKFDGLDWTATEDGAVHIDGALATLDCAVHAVHEAGDHLVVTARVHALDAREDGTPLVFYRSDYATGVFS